MKPESQLYRSSKIDVDNRYSFPCRAEDTQDMGMEEMQVRATLCSSLAEMSESMRALLSLMGRHNFITLLSDQTFPHYEGIMERIGNTASQAAQAIEHSRSLDRRIFLAHLPMSEAPKQ